MRFTSWVFLISLKRTWEHSSHSLWLDSGTSSGCSQMSRFLQQDDLIRFNPVILVIRFSCLIPSSLQVQCLVRDTTTASWWRGSTGEQRTEEGGSSLAVHLVVMDIWSRKWGPLNFGVLWCKHHFKFHKDHSRSFLGGAADFCICSYEVVLYLQPDVKPDSWTTIDVSHTRFVAANHEHINLTGSLGFWIRDDFPTKTPARFFTGFLEGNIPPSFNHSNSRATIGILVVTGGSVVRQVWETLLKAEDWSGSVGFSAAIGRWRKWCSWDIVYIQFDI